MHDPNAPPLKKRKKGPLLCTSILFNESSKSINFGYQTIDMGVTKWFSPLCIYSSIIQISILNGDGSRRNTVLK